MSHPEDNKFLLSKGMFLNIMYTLYLKIQKLWNILENAPNLGVHIFVFQLFKLLVKSSLHIDNFIAYNHDLRF